MDGWALPVLVVIIAAVVLWPLTLGRRYFTSENKDWPEIRRDLYSGSVDEGMYPLDPSPDRGTREER